jgi:hypothetical protein
MLRDFALVPGVLLLAACVEHDAVGITLGSNDTSFTQNPSLEPEARRLRVEAAQGVTRRGLQDDMLAIEATLPGFAGFYIDSTDKVVILLRGDTASAAAGSRSRVARLLRQSLEPRVRSLGASAATARLVPALWSLSELIAVENRIVRGAVPGLAGVGVSLVRNSVEVGFATDADRIGSSTLLQVVGAPPEMLELVTWGPVVVSGSWTDRYRPTRGGFGLCQRAPQIQW